MVWKPLKTLFTSFGCTMIVTMFCLVHEILCFLCCFSSNAVKKVVIGFVSSDVCCWYLKFVCMLMQLHGIDYGNSHRRVILFILYTPEILSFSLEFFCMTCHLITLPFFYH